MKIRNWLVDSSLYFWSAREEMGRWLFLGPVLGAFFTAVSLEIHKRAWKGLSASLSYKWGNEVSRGKVTVFKWLEHDNTDPNTNGTLIFFIKLCCAASSLTYLLSPWCLWSVWLWLRLCALTKFLSMFIKCR